MVFVTSDSFQQVFGWVKEDSLAGSCSVLIFVAPDADSLCACKILTTLLQSELISYNVKPVSSYEDLVKANEELISKNEDLRSIFMINCGGTIDVSTLLDLKEEMAVYIVDSHRPLHLSNVSNKQEHVFVLVSDKDDAKSVPAALLAAEEEDEDLDEGNDDDDLEADDQSDEDEGDVDVDGEEDEEDENEDEEAGEDEERDPRRRRTDEDSYTAVPSSSQRQQQKRINKRKKQQELRRLKKEEARQRRMEARMAKRRENLLEKLMRRTAAGAGSAEYYRGSFYSNAASTVLYQCAYQLAKDTVPMLWLGILGLTDQWIHHRIDGKRYLEGVRYFQNEVSRMAKTPGLDAAAGGMGAALNQEISFEYEYRFALLRHWSLYDSMFHSPYVACRMSIWKANGEKRLRELLALMGIPLSESQQPYLSMNLELKQLLHERLSKYAPAFGLEEISFPSFVRAQGYRTPLSASDTVQAVSALLEAGTSSDRKRRNYEDEDENDEEDKDDHGSKESSFWQAYDALSVTGSTGSHNWELVRQGLERARVHLRALVRMGAWLIEKKLIVRLGPFRYVVLKDSPDLAHFLQPLSLARLALFLDETMREKGKAQKPFLICALDEEKGTYLVVGLAANASNAELLTAAGSGAAGAMKKNTFGSSFKIAASRTNAKIQHHSFDSSVVEVRKEDITKFIEFLLTQMTVAS